MADDPVFTREEARWALDPTNPRPTRSDDEMWHGAALSRALDRAAKAERRVEELEAAARRLLAAIGDAVPACPRGYGGETFAYEIPAPEWMAILAADDPLQRLLGRHPDPATTSPADASTPPAAPTPPPTPQDAPEPSGGAATGHWCPSCPDRDG